MCTVTASLASSLVVTVSATGTPLGEFHRVPDQVCQDLAHGDRISNHLRGHAGVDRRSQLERLIARRRLIGRHHLIHNLK